MTDYSNDYILAFDPNNLQVTRINERDTYTAIEVYFDSPRDTIINLNFPTAIPHLVLNGKQDSDLWVKLKGKFTDNNKAEFVFPMGYWTTLRAEYNEQLIGKESLSFYARVLIEVDGANMVLPSDKSLELITNLTLEGEFA